MMAMWLVPMATETMLSELMSCEPDRAKTELLLTLPAVVGTGRAGGEMVSVCVCVWRGWGCSKFQSSITFH